MDSRDPLTDYNTPLAAALSYATRGWRIFPLYTMRNGRCTCGKECGKDAGKHPRINAWQNEATTDEAQIRSWWRRWPDANVGIVTGAKSGLVVLDVDPRSGGDEALAQLIEKHGALPNTVQSITGGGGTHNFFTHPGGYVKSGTDRLGPGLDIKADGGYVVAPPSLHPSGQGYCWELSSEPQDVALAPLPPWLLAELANSSQAASSRVVLAPVRIREHTRNTTLTRIAGAMRHWGCGPHAMLSALLIENEERCDPPLPEAEVERLVNSVARYEPGNVPTSVRSNGQLAIPDFPILKGPGIGTGTGETSAVIRLWELAEPAPRRWTVEGLVPDGAITILYGDGGLGKSLVGLYVATLACLGRPFAGQTVEKRVVLYLDAELDSEELGRRAYKVARGMGLSAPPDGLHYYRLPESLADPNAHAAVHKAIREAEADLCILDSLSNGAYGSELKEARDVTVLMKAAETWGTVLAIDHMPAPGPGASHLGYRPFGSTFKYNQARSVIQLVKADGGAITLRQTKSNFGPLSPPINLALEFTAGCVTFEAIDAGDERLAGIEAHMPARERVYLDLARYGKEGATPEQQAEGGSLNMTAKTIRNHLSSLKKEGRAESLGGGRWRVRSGPDQDPFPGSRSLNNQGSGTHLTHEVCPAAMERYGYYEAPLPTQAEYELAAKEWTDVQAEFEKRFLSHID